MKEVEESTILCIIDLEATCDSPVQSNPQEIIEFPAVLLNATTCEIIDEFRTFCKPEIHPKLSKFCTELTGISQKQVDNGVPLREAVEKFRGWIEDKHNLEPEEVAVVTCGSWDFGTMFPSECQIKGIGGAEVPEYLKRWINIKLTFKECYGKRKAMSFLKMMDELCMKVEGRHHSGIDDTRNITRIAVQLIKDGFLDKFEINGHVKYAI